MRPTTLYSIEEELILESVNQYSWVGCFVGNGLGEDIQDWCYEKLDENDVIEIEDKPHVTIKYGLVTQEPKEVSAILTHPTSMSCMFGKTAIFESPEHDVLYLEVISKDFVDLHQFLSNSLTNKQTHKEYIPHLTLAYLKKGTSKKYVGKKVVSSDLVLSFTQVSFTNKDKVRTVIPLRGKYEKRW